jgi:hypothetical protein
MPMRGRRPQTRSRVHRPAFRVYGGRIHAVNKTLYQLRVVADIAARDFFRCQRLYIRAVRDTFKRHGAAAGQALDECLKAAEAYQDALNDLWVGLLNAAPFPDREEEMRRTMARYEITVSELHAIQRFAFDF